MRACHACGLEWTERDAPGFSVQCGRCGAFLHCCLNCKFHAPGAHHDCREPEADPVSDKEKRNTCEYFAFADRAPGGRSGDAAGDRSAAARAKLDQLFGKKD